MATSNPKCSILFIKAYFTVNILNSDDIGLLMDSEFKSYGHLRYSKVSTNTVVYLTWRRIIPELYEPGKMKTVIITHIFYEYHAWFHWPTFFDWPTSCRIHDDQESHRESHAEKQSIITLCWRNGMMVHVTIGVNIEQSQAFKNHKLRWVDLNKNESLTPGIIIWPWLASFNCVFLIKMNLMVLLI